MNIFGVGLPEIAVIAAIALILFGPKRLPELGRTLGKTLKGIQNASSEFEREIQNAMNESDSSESDSRTLDIKQASTEKTTQGNEISQDGKSSSND